jgi:hypothetical protein
MGDRKLGSVSQEEFAAIISERRQARMDHVDRLPQSTRDLVHQYGYAVVKAFLDCGVTKSSRIRHLVETVLNEFSPSRGTNSAQGPRGLRWDDKEEAGQ